MSAVECDIVTDKPAPDNLVSRERGKENTYRPESISRVGTKHICGLARQLATLLHAGMPLVPALSVLVEQLREVDKRRVIRFGFRDGSLAEIMEQVAENVRAGSALADALSKYPGVFSPLFVNMVAAGEASGMLEDVLLRLADMLEKRVNLASKVKSAVAYPLMMIIVAVGVITFLLSFVVPGITQIFIEMNRVLPWPTKLLISMSSFVKTYFVFITIAVFAGIFAIGICYRTKEGKLFVDRFKLKLPLFGNLFLKLETARLARTLGALLAGGVLILNALKIVKVVIQNSFISASLNSVEDSVSKGETVANAMKKTGLFPPIVFHIIATAQVSGNVEDGFMSIADMYDGEVELTTKTLTSLLEPVILLVMGVIIGFIVLAVLLPIFEINQAL
jgi:general secretion pathway protein F